MDEYPATPVIPTTNQSQSQNAELMASHKERRGKFAPYSSFIRLLLVLVGGLLLGFLTWSLLPSRLDSSTFPYPQWSLWLGSFGVTAIVLLFPPGLGVAVSFMWDRRGEPLIKYAVGRALLAWSGMLIYWFFAYPYIDAVLHQAAIEACKRVNNHGFCGLSLTPYAIFLYLIFSGIFMLLAAVVTAPIIKYAKQ